ncbi:MAG: DUF86 domain-containing protein [Nanoarchaeota archaeon]|nr:DUF86 domain-containing protein [Nanoarchaeota archaeon]
MKRTSKAYLGDILEAIDRIREYIGSMDIEELKENKLVLDAVMRNLEIIGEAVTQMPDEIKNRYPTVPWRDIKDFRNVVAHHYFSINILRIWDIIEHKLEPLEAQINNILKKEKLE